jgi:5-methylcytosine-specific restriction protein A
MWRAPIAGAEEAKARRAEYRRGADELRREKDQYRKFYGTAAWAQLRFWKLCNSPMCEATEKDGAPCRAAATVVHHKRDHKGDPALFFDRDNLQALCKPHHDQETARRVNEARSPK